MLCSTRLYNDCKNIRHIANAALKEKEPISRCVEKERKVKIKIESKVKSVAKKYDDIPGPKGIFGIGTFYQYFPIIGM